MAREGLETNIDRVYEEFLKLNSKEMRRALRSGLSAAANQLRTDTKRNVRTMFPQARRKNPRFFDTMYDAVLRSKVEENARGEMTTKVHVMGTRKTGSGTYRLRFFEKGTVPRFTRTGNHYRGVIRPMWFFRTANDAFGPQYDRIMNQQLDKAIQRINKKKIR